jgi:hypothetical protein
VIGRRIATQASVSRIGAIVDRTPVIYPCRIDLVAVDADYWVVRHQIVDAWQELETLIRDEEAVAACWAFEQDYLGIEIAGTIHNELRMEGRLDFPSAGRTTNRMPKGVAQHEPSGGGRSTPQHRRVAAQVARADNLNRTEQRTAGVLRRTRLRRSRHEITSVGMLIAAEAVDMTGWPTIYPTPGTHCAACEFNTPCLVLTEGADPEPVRRRTFGRHPIPHPNRDWVSPPGALAGVPRRRSGDQARSAGYISRPMSSTRAEWVSAPTAR